MMNNDQGSGSEAVDRGMARVVAGFNAGWRAVSRTLARMMPATPAIADPIQSVDSDMTQAKKQSSSQP